MDTALAARVFDACHLTGHFVLRSGATSDVYFDKYLLEADPQLLHDVTKAMVPLVPEGTEVLAGLETGGIPLATMLSQHTGIPTAFVRKEAKTYGTAKLAEGASVEGKRVCVVEDVVTSGGQLLASIGDLRERGAKIEHAVCVINREAGGPEATADIDVALAPLFTRSELESAQS